MFHQGLLCRRRRLRSDPSHYVTSLTCALCWRRRRSDLDKPARILPGRLSKAKSVRIFPLFIAVQFFFSQVDLEGKKLGFLVKRGIMGNAGSMDHHTDLRGHNMPLKLPMPDAGELEERFAIVLVRKKSFASVFSLFPPCSGAPGRDSCVCRLDPLFLVLHALILSLLLSLKKKSFQTEKCLFICTRSASVPLIWRFLSLTKLLNFVVCFFLTVIKVAMKL